MCNSFLGRAGLVAGLFAVAGCGGSSGPQLAPVSGVVTYRDKPVPNADITFAPEKVGDRPATGHTDENGRYVLGTLSTDDGAVLGKHRITVMAYGPPRPAKPGEGTGMPGETMPGPPLIPQKYFAAESSGLTHEVVRGSNQVDLKLTD